MVGKTIRSFDLDLSDISQAGETRPFSIVGDSGAEFRLEIKNEDSYYYNFVTGLFQVTRASFDKTLGNRALKGTVEFPAITDNDQYDVYLYALPGTKHPAYNEVRFGDGSLDINSSVGSNSLMLRKVIYQYTTLTLTFSGYSPNGTVATTAGTDTISIDRGKPKAKTAFSFTNTAAVTAAYRILKQPTNRDIISFVSPVVGSAPVSLPGENIYPLVNGTDAVNGAVTSGTTVTMDNAVASKMKVGDRGDDLGARHTDQYYSGYSRWQVSRHYNYF